ncbi:MAG TPA: hypothetical protein VH352_08145 [Pseudonocardiaceae bacterium]|jgi:hypothetical protein|nr:hypothetical protein [Pseudonocardiaceae bacterium]
MTDWNRLVDVLAAIQSDRRIAIHFVIDSGSRFAAGLRGYLSSIGITPLSWARAKARHFDLVLAAHANCRMAELSGPRVLLPHGAGYSRIVPWATGDDTSPAGMARAQIVGVDGSLPRVICLSHQAQHDQLRSACREAGDRGVVIGDPTFDRMDANKSRRARYRRALGVGDRRTLVVLTSTWGRHSTVGIDDTLAHRLVAQLPSDEFRVALVLHPNVWFRHTMWTIRRAFKDPLDAGMMIIPPESGWQAVLLAADVVIGDHGSVAFYGAALGTPFLLAATGLAELDQRSPRSLLPSVATRLDPDGDLAAQVRAVIARHDPGPITAVTDLTLGRPGESLAILQRELYQVLDLLPAGRPRTLAFPDPKPERGDEPTAHLVAARVRPDGHAIELTRYPAILRDHRRPDDRTELCTVVENSEVDQRQRESADVLVNADTATERNATAWIKRILDRYPGAGMAVASTKTDCLIGLRDGTRLLATSTSRLDPAHVAAAVHGWLVEGRAEPTATTLHVCLGPNRWSMSIRPLRYPGRSP